MFRNMKEDMPDMATKDIDEYFIRQAQRKFGKWSDNISERKNPTEMKSMQL